MVNKARQKIRTLQQQPEHKRVRTVSLYTIGAGVIASLVWLVLLLPAQLYFSKSDAKPSLQESQVQGAIDMQNETPSPPETTPEVQQQEETP